MAYRDVDPVRTVTLLDVQCSNVPDEVMEDVRKLWGDLELGNDFFYVTWGEDDFGDNLYPALCDYLRSRGIEECLIHYWW